LSKGSSKIKSMIVKDTATNINREKDIELVRRILSGDEKALLLFYKEYNGMIFSYIKNKIGDVGDGEEILQDALMATITAMRDFSGRSSLSTFVYAITRNKIADYYRKKKIKQMFFSQMPGLYEIISNLAGPEEELDQNLLKEKIKITLEKLAPEYRMILVFKYVYGLPVQTIARKLSLSLKTIESRLFRARKAFIKIYE